MTTLLLREDDIAKITALSGNIDKDAIMPFVKSAQTTEMRRILGIDLYNKILTDFDTDTLAGKYLIIYDEFIVDMLVYFTAADFIQIGSYKINNGGVFKATAENGSPVELVEINALASNYKSLGYAVELIFADYMKTAGIPEYDKGCDDSNYGFNWY